ncbi:MAG: SH3 domain-containing protein [Anoxybacillus sp.]|nr:SH3 domain-containing protein [Anoxybacillus sp.]MCL6585101.1 SH3 domain-containing protein [Anoxybacillus sp.]
MQTGTDRAITKILTSQSERMSRLEKIFGYQSKIMKVSNVSLNLERKFDLSMYQSELSRTFNIIAPQLEIIQLHTRSIAASLELTKALGNNPISRMYRITDSMQAALNASRQLGLLFAQIYNSINSPIAELQRTINQTLELYKINLSPTIKALEQWQVQFKELQKINFPKVEQLLRDAELTVIEQDEKENWILDGEFVRREELEEAVLEVLGRQELVKQQPIVTLFNSIVERLEKLEKTQKLGRAQKIKQFVWATVISILINILSGYFEPFFETSQKIFYQEVMKHKNILLKQVRKEYKDKKYTFEELKPFRMVSASQLPVRQTNKRNTKAVDMLHFGQVVRVIEKRRNWSLVAYQKEDGEVIKGWVLTRYLEKLAK